MIHLLAILTREETMKKFSCRIGIAVFLVSFVALLYFPGSIQAAEISTDKTTYVHGEKIKVTFSGSSGHDGNWISLSKADSPDKQAGDYDYIPKGLTQGTMTFETTAPGKYEARGYYNYARDGYVVSARCSFEVVASPEGGGLNLMERKVDPANALESSLPPGNGLVYIFNWYSIVIADKDVQIRANGSPIVVLSNKKYFPYSVLAGSVRFTAEGYLELDTAIGRVEEIKSGRPGEATVEVKSGCVYFLNLTVLPTPFWNLNLDQVSPEEGDKLIKGGKLSAVK